MDHATRNRRVERGSRLIVANARRNKTAAIKSCAPAPARLGGIEVANMIRKGRWLLDSARLPSMQRWPPMGTRSTASFIVSQSLRHNS